MNELIYPYLIIALAVCTKMHKSVPNFTQIFNLFWSQYLELSSLYLFQQLIINDMQMAIFLIWYLSMNWILWVIQNFPPPIGYAVKTILYLLDSFCLMWFHHTGLDSKARPAWSQVFNTFSLQMDKVTQFLTSYMTQGDGTHIWQVQIFHWRGLSIHVQLWKWSEFVSGELKSKVLSHVI